MKRRQATLSAGLVCAVLAGCAGAPPAVSSSAASKLAPEVAAVRSAATEHDPAAARARLGELRATVTALQGEGRISAARAAAILASVADVEAQLGSATTTTVPPTPTTATPVSPPGNGGGREKKHGND